MQKNFDTWNEEKKIINIRQDTPHIFFKEQEIWWCFFGLNIGYEQDGKGQGFLRPVLVIKKFNPDTFVALPLTTKTRMRSYLIPCPSLDEVFRQANISQLKVLDIKRLDRRITFVQEEVFKKIRKAVRELFSDPLPSKSGDPVESPEP
jgi:mRNA interferase MazF